jgi:protein subunit release factor A
MMQISFNKKDFRLDWFSGTGAGGQYRNKHQNCCRIVHIETGLMATGQSHRERPANQKEAFQKLAQKLIAYYSEPDPERRRLNNVVRTYHFERGVATDGAITKDVNQAISGKLDDFMANALQGRRPARETGRM